MKTVLVLPPYGMTQSYGGKGSMKRGILPPLGIGYLASSLETHGHAAAFVDASVLGLDTDGAATAALAEKPDVIGISCLTRLAPAAYALAAELKRRAPSIPLVLGGPHATSFADSILEECPAIDILIPGEAELTLAETLDRLERKAPLDDVPGVLFRDPDGRVVATRPRPAVRDLDALPFPARRIYRNDLYVPLPNQCRRRPATTVITSRGCPYARCAFCYQGGRYASPYRRRTPEHVVDEMAQLKREYGIREIIFWDDNFAVDFEWIDAFCNLLDRNKMDMTWTAYGRVNTVSPEMLQRMAASGCYSIYYGFESGNSEMLQRVCKGITLDECRSAVRWAKKADMEIRGSFILGMPGETPETAEETIRFACELNVDWMVFLPYRLQPATRLAETALREGVVLDDHPDIHFPTYLPKGFPDVESLANTVRSAYRRYYLRPGYISRALWRSRHPAVLRNYWDSFRYWLSLVT
ncbi:MAG TPA: radical SAM protein [Candidatus Hydrogenedentes bacterium]|nr:radical SAM protein [Candidatus Hydrogenedentota bacterium]